MALTLSPILLDAGIDPRDALVLRHAYVLAHEDSGLPGIHADSTGAEILEYTRNQSANTEIPGRSASFLGRFHQGRRRSGAAMVCR